jgi:hypothetical protein
MSALPPKADIAEREWDVHFAPKETFVGAGARLYLFRGARPEIGGKINDVKKEGRPRRPQRFF